MRTVTAGFMCSLLLVAGVFAQTARTGTKPAHLSAAADDGRVVFSAGQKLLLKYAHKLQVTDQGEATTVELSLEFPVKVRKGSNGLLQLDMEVSRVKLHATGRIDADVDTEGKSKPGGEFDDYVAMLKNCRFQAVVTPGGVVKGFRGVGQPASAMTQDQVDNFRQMLQSCAMYLPFPRAKKGDTYDVKRTFLAGPWVVGGAPMELDVSTACVVGSLTRLGSVSRASVKLGGQCKCGRDTWNQTGSVDAEYGRVPHVKARLELTGKIDIGDAVVSELTELGPLQAKTKPQNGPSSMPAGKPIRVEGPVEFRSPYAAGKTLMTVSRLTMKVRVGDREPDGCYQQLYLRAAIDGTGSQSELKIDRAKASGVRPADTNDVRTAGQDTMGLWDLLKLTATARFDKSGRIVVKYQPAAGGDKQSVDAMNREAKIIESWFTTMASEAGVYLPTKPVHVGGEWTVERKTCNLIFQEGPLIRSEKSTCRFAGVYRMPQGRVAVIEVKGQCKPSRDPKENVEFRDVVLKKDGKIQYNLDKHMVEKSYFVMNGSTAETVPGIASSKATASSGDAIPVNLDFTQDIAFTTE